MAHMRAAVIARLVYDTITRECDETVTAGQKERRGNACEVPTVRVVVDGTAAHNEGRVEKQQDLQGTSVSPHCNGYTSVILHLSSAYLLRSSRSNEGQAVLERIGVGVVGFGGLRRFSAGCLVSTWLPAGSHRGAGRSGGQRRIQRYPRPTCSQPWMRCSLVKDRRSVVASSDHAHYDNALQALKHRKHVLLEKPMAQTVEQCDGLVRAWHSHAKDRVFMVGLELRHCTLFTRMRELLDEGVIGHVVMGQAIDNVSVGDKYFYHNMYSRKSFVRSLLLQKGVHTIDLVNWFMDSRPSKVYAVGGLNVYGGQAPEDSAAPTCDEADSCPHVCATPRRRVSRISASFRAQT